MKAVILVGGEGTRLRPLTWDLPKPMLPVLNRPFLEHTMAWLKRSRVDEVVLAAGYLPGSISSYFGDGSGCGLRLTFSVEDRPLGTAGAVKMVEGRLDGAFIVLNGDIFADLDLDGMAAFHRSKGAKVTIALTRVEDPTAFGCVETDSSGAVTRFVEKPRADEVATHWINAGAYILEPEVLRHVPAGAHHMFERGLFPMLVGWGEPVFGYPMHGYWLDMGTPGKYLRLNRDLLEGRASGPLVPSRTAEGIWRGEGCEVSPGARLEGPLMLGHGCRVSSGARLVGPTVLGPGCRVREGALVEATVLWEGAQVQPGAHLQGCIIGRNVMVGPGRALAGQAVVSEQVRPGEDRMVSFAPA